MSVIVDQRNSELMRHEIANEMWIRRMRLEKVQVEHNEN